MESEITNFNKKTLLEQQRSSPDHLLRIRKPRYAVLRSALLGLFHVNEDKLDRIWSSGTVLPSGIFASQKSQIWDYFWHFLEIWDFFKK